MLCFFSLSYREWASTHDVALGGDPELGLWLKDTQLFKEAWGNRRRYASSILVDAADFLLHGGMERVLGSRR